MPAAGRATDPTADLDAGLGREGEGVEIAALPGQRVVPPLGEPPPVAFEEVTVVVDAVDGGPPAAVPVLAELAHEQAAHGRSGLGPVGELDVGVEDHELEELEPLDRAPDERPRAGVRPVAADPRPGGR